MITGAFAARRVRDTLLFVFGARSPTDAEWDQLIGYCREAAGVRQVQLLVVTEGGSPNAKQRARLEGRVDVTGVRVAIVTASALARAAGIAVRWFNPHLRVFAPAELERALDYLELQDEYRQEARVALAELRSEHRPGATSQSHLRPGTKR